MLSSSALIYQNFFGPETQELPYELVLSILSHLPLNAVPALALVNSQWNNAANDNLLWKARFESRYPHEMENVAQQDIIDWQNEFKSEKQLTPENHLKRRLERFIASKDSEGDKDYDAAVVLNQVLFLKGRQSLLDSYSRNYTNGSAELVAIYNEANHLNLLNDPDNSHSQVTKETNEFFSTYYPG